ncbi:MAG: type IV pilus assembly protein PilX, partial [Lentisphaeria bacterium]
MKKLNVAKKSPSRFSINRQSGAVLVVSLVILAVVSLIAISGMETTSTEVQMANNFYERELAL